MIRLDKSRLDLEKKKYSLWWLSANLSFHLSFTMIKCKLEWTNKKFTWHVSSDSIYRMTNGQTHLWYQISTKRRYLFLLPFSTTFIDTDRDISNWRYIQLTSWPQKGHQFLRGITSETQGDDSELVLLLQVIPQREN